MVSVYRDGHHVAFEDDRGRVILTSLNHDVEHIAGEETAAANEMVYAGTSRGCRDSCDLDERKSRSCRIVDAVWHEVDGVPELICGVRFQVMNHDRDLGVEFSVRLRASGAIT